MKERQYLIIDAKNIKKERKNQTINITDTEINVVETNEMITITAENIFDEKNIPKEYQKIILEITVFNPMKYGDAQEYLTQIPFDLTGQNLTKDEEENVIVHGKVIDHPVYLTTKLQKETYDKVINFYISLKESGYLEKYLEVIKEFFASELAVSKIPTEHNQPKKRKKLLDYFKLR